MNVCILIAPVTRMWKGGKKKKRVTLCSRRDILKLFDLSGRAASPQDEKIDNSGGRVGCEEW